MALSEASLATRVEVSSLYFQMERGPLSDKRCRLRKDLSEILRCGGRDDGGLRRGTRGNHPSILGNAYFYIILGSVTHFMLVLGNELFSAVTATALYAAVLLENMSTP